MLIAKILFKHVPNVISAKTLALCLLLQSNSALAFDKDEFRRLEEEISASTPDNIYKIEPRIARLIQNDARSQEAGYLMAALYLKMYTYSPQTYSLIRQSSELATQLYDLDKQSDLAICSLVSIFELTGESARASSLIQASSQNRNTAMSWRLRLLEARLNFDDKNYKRALELLDENTQDKDLSHEMQAELLVEILNEYYRDKDLLINLGKWNQKIQSKTLKIAYAAALARNNQLLDAKAEYAKVLDLSPNNPLAFFGLALVEQRLNRQSSAVEKNFKLAILNAESDFDRNAAQTLMALHLIQQNADQNIIADAVISSLRESKDRERLFITFANSHIKRSTPRAILDLLSKIEMEIPGIPLVYAIKGELLNDKFKNYEDAVISFSNAISIDGGRSEFFNGRGLTLMQMGNLDRAVIDFEHATIVNPDDASSRYNYACALARLGRKQEALRSLSLAITMDDKLLNLARQDSDFQSLQSETEFHALTQQRTPMLGH